MLHRFNFEPPKYKTKFESWKEWAKNLLPHVTNEIIGLERSVKDPVRDRQIIRMISTLKNFSWKLNLFINVVDKHWVYVEGEERWTFKPIWVSIFGNNYIFSHGEKFLLMSATILSPVRLAQNLGIGRSQWKYKSIPSQFPAENRKVIYHPVANISQKTKNEELPKIIPAIRSILSHHKEEKGLIHTVSYSNAKYIMDNIRDRRLVIHDSKNREETFRRFKLSSTSMVMVSPSMDRGVDLPYELCRFQIITKVPFPDISDKQIAARLYSSDYGRQWYLWLTACTIVQMTGRSTRAEDDFSVCYIIDSNFGKFYQENHQLFPKWWKEALEVGN
jgi:Rad3-related DNA helicase